MTVFVRPLAILAALAALAELSPAAAQSTAEIRGHVINATSKTPIGIATVEVSISAAAISHRASTDADGAFRIQGLAPGHYRVNVRALGYLAKTLPPIDISSSSLSVDVGTVALTPAPLQLQAVDVTAQKQTVELAPDRNTYIVRDMPTTRGGTALDVLRNVPSVDVDIDNIVSLRGNSGVVVQINGRPSPLKPAQLGNFLAQLPADMVDKVEIIPNPSARDDPTGVAGIINLTLKQDADAGRSGGLTVASGTTGQVNVGGNVGYQRGPLSFYGSYGFLRDRRPRADAIFRQNNYLTPVTYLDESATRLQEPFAHTLTGSAGYKLGKQDALSLDGFYTTRNQHESYDILYRDLNAARSVTGLSDRNTTGTGHEFNFESTLGYKHAFAGKGTQAVGRASGFARWRRWPEQHQRRHACSRSDSDCHNRTRDADGVGTSGREFAEGRLRAPALEFSPHGDRLQGIAADHSHDARHAGLRCSELRIRSRPRSHQRLHIQAIRQRRVRNARRTARQVSASGRRSRRARRRHSFI